MRAAALLTRSLAGAVLLALAACQQSAETPAAEQASESLAPSPEGSASATPAALASFSVLEERENPDRVLAWFSQQLADGKWDDAALAWRKGSMDGAKLKALMGDAPGPIFAFGHGEVEGAAGSLYYELPVTLVADGGKVTRQGTLTMKRVNDVPGAEDWQLAWHIERLEWAQ